MNVFSRFFMLSLGLVALLSTTLTPSKVFAVPTATPLFRAGIKLLEQHEMALEQRVVKALTVYANELDETAPELREGSAYRLKRDLTVLTYHLAKQAGHERALKFFADLLALSIEHAPKKIVDMYLNVRTQDDVWLTTAELEHFGHITDEDSTRKGRALNLSLVKLLLITRAQWARRLPEWNTHLRVRHRRAHGLIDASELERRLDFSRISLMTCEAVMAFNMKIGSEAPLQTR